MKCRLERRASPGTTSATQAGPREPGTGQEAAAAKGKARGRLERMRAEALAKISNAGGNQGLNVIVDPRTQDTPSAKERAQLPHD